MGWVNFARRNQGHRTTLGAFLPSCKNALIPEGHPIAWMADALNRLSFVFFGPEHLNLEGMIGAFMQVEKRSARDQLCSYASLFLHRGEPQ